MLLLASSAQGQEPEVLPEAPEEPRTDVAVADTVIDRVFEMINSDIGAEIKAMGQVSGQSVRLVAVDATVEEILDELLIGREWTWIRREDGTYEMWDRQSFVDQELRTRVIRRPFTLKYIVANDVMASIQELKSEVGTIAVDPRTNTLTVTDLPDKVALIESILAELDIQLYKRSFYIRYADFEQIHPVLGRIKSGPGSIELDPMNRLIIVEDTLQKIKEMEQMVELLDVDRPLMLYHLNSIGLEAADASELIELFIRPIATVDAMIEFFPSQSVLVVKDVIEVHDRILELLEALDHPPAQVWIEGEILEVRQDFKFDFGVELTYDRDLASAFRDQGIALPRINAGSAGLSILQLTGDLRATISAMMSDDSARLLLRPRALVRNGQQVDIDLTEGNPQITTFFNRNQGNFGGNFNSSSISFVDTGIQLTLQPTITNTGLIEMEVDFINSTPIFRELNTGQGGTQSAVGINQQAIRTSLIIPSGETRVLGGLVRHSSSEAKSGVPFLSQIPFLGALFGNHKTSEEKRSLFFFLTPTIVREKPQINVVQVPINSAAKKWSQDLLRPLEGPPSLNPLPEHLRPFLLLEEPKERWDDFITSPGLMIGEFSLDDSRFERLEGFLSDAPFPRQREQAALGISGPGARLLSGSATGGPSGVITPGTRAIAPPTRRPPPPPRTRPGVAPPTTTPPTEAPPTLIPSTPAPEGQTPAQPSEQPPGTDQPPATPPEEAPEQAPPSPPATETTVP